MKFRQVLALGFLSAFYVSCGSTAVEDLGHTVQGDPIESSLEKVSSAESDPHLPMGGFAHIDQDSKYQQQKEVASYLGDTTKDYVELENLKKSEIKDVNIPLGNTLENKSEYEETDYKKYVKEFYNLGEQTVHISYFKNSYNYKSPGDVFNRTIGNGVSTGKHGPLLIHSDQYLFKSRGMNGFYTVGAGFSYHRGKGTFVDGTTSTTTFQLWEIPVDAGVGIELPLLSWFRIYGLGGVSGVTLYQSRDDYADREEGKRRFQFGYGPFAQGSAKFLFSSLFPETAFEYFSQSEITNLSFDFNLRYQNYNGFKEDISITGTSVGVGFGFEFL